MGSGENNHFPYMNYIEVDSGTISAKNILGYGSKTAIWYVWSTTKKLWLLTDLQKKCKNDTRAEFFLKTYKRATIHFVKICMLYYYFIICVISWVWDICSIGRFIISTQYIGNIMKHLVIRIITYKDTEKILGMYNQKSKTSVLW